MSFNEPQTYRMKLSGFVWHFHKNCAQYPENNYNEKTIVEPNEFMMVCIKCKKLQNSLEAKKSD